MAAVMQVQTTEVRMEDPAATIATAHKAATVLVATDQTVMTHMDPFPAILSPHPTHLLTRHPTQHPNQHPTHHLTRLLTALTRTQVATEWTAAMVQAATIAAMTRESMVVVMIVRAMVIVTQAQATIPAMLQTATALVPTDLIELTSKRAKICLPHRPNIMKQSFEIFSVTLFMKRIKLFSYLQKKKKKKKNSNRTPPF